MCVYIHTYIYMYICILYIYVYIYIYAYVYIYIYIYVFYFYVSFPSGLARPDPPLEAPGLGPSLWAGLLEGGRGWFWGLGFVEFLGFGVYRV